MTAQLFKDSQFLMEIPDTAEISVIITGDVHVIIIMIMSIILLLNKTTVTIIMIISNHKKKAS